MDSDRRESYLSGLESRAGLVCRIYEEIIDDDPPLQDLIKSLEDVVESHKLAVESCTTVSEEDGERLELAFSVRRATACWAVVKYVAQNRVSLRHGSYICIQLGEIAELELKFGLDQFLFDYCALLREYHDYLQNSLSEDTQEWIFVYLAWTFIQRVDFPPDRLRMIESFKSKIYETEFAFTRVTYRVDYLIKNHRRFDENDSITYKRMVVNLLYFIKIGTVDREEFGKHLRDDITPQIFEGIKGITSRRSLLLSLCKLQVLTGPLWTLLPGMVEQLDLLQTAYELRAKQTKYSREQCALLPTCLDLAFATSHDDPMSSVYVCEFSYFRDTLNNLERKGLLREDDLEKLDEHTKERLRYYQHVYDNFHMCCAKSPREVEFLCLGHLCKTEETTMTCPLMNRRFLFDREGRHWTDPRCTAVYSTIP